MTDAAPRPWVNRELACGLLLHWHQQSAPIRGSNGTRQRLHRFHGSVTLDPTRVGRDAGRVAEEVLAHLLALPGAQAHVSLEVQVSGFDDVSDQVQRIVTENARTLKFGPGGGFESE